MALTAVPVGLLLLILTPCFTSAGQTSLPEGMHQDMYCIGCEVTMKVVDRALRETASQDLERAVPETLSKVCQAEHFEISEYSKDTITTACKHIVERHRAELTRELVKEYRRAKRASYLDLVQRVCLNLTDACHGVLHDHHDHDPLKNDARMTLDPETNEFVVLPGKNLKTANPVRAQVREEL